MNKYLVPLNEVIENVKKNDTPINELGRPYRNQRPEERKDRRGFCDGVDIEGNMCKNMCDGILHRKNEVDPSNSFIFCSVQCVFRYWINSTNTTRGRGRPKTEKKKNVQVATETSSQRLPRASSQKRKKEIEEGENDDEVLLKEQPKKKVRQAKDDDDDYVELEGDEDEDEE